MKRRFLSGVLGIITGTALILTSFAVACLDDGGSVNGPPTPETPSAAFQCGYLGIDLNAVIREKMAYNADRPYKHGKQF